MVFSSSLFLFVFLPLTILIYYVSPKRYRNFSLFLASFIFYAWSGLSYAVLIAVSTVVNYIAGLGIDSTEGRRRKIYLVLTIIYNLLILGFFKYFNFFVDNAVFLIRIFIPDYSLNAPFIPLPIGISFFTFQIMSYIIDLYRKEIKVQKNLVHLALYIMLFPQLIAGPIVRYIDVQTQIEKREVTLDCFSKGLKRFVLGLGKKVIIANAMGTWADIAFNNISGLSTPLAWLGIVGYTMQIFFDFSAYSDMAIGLGKMFGFDFLENFNYPYIALSIQDFWRRWHMSLTTWFRDYLYIPLGGNRRGKKRTYLNNLIVFFCTGFWHGAAWNFILWGFYHGFIQMFEKSGFGEKITNMPKALRHIYTFILVMVGWVLFRAENLKEALIYLRYMFIWNGTNLYLFFKTLDNWSIIVCILAIIFSTPIAKHIAFRMESSHKKTMYEQISYLSHLLLFAISIMLVAGSSFNPFIYFRF